jgi:phosphoserine phosphatase
VPTALVTGTNRFLSQPLVDAVGITTLLATEPEIVNGRFTGGIVEPFLLKEGKLLKAREYCQLLQTDLKHTAFFADSINDLEMLTSVGTPVVVNPAEKLLAEAKARRWRIECWSL